MYIYKNSSSKKVHQRGLNKCFREMNQNVANDNLWRGRFVVKQYATFFNKWEDNSGYYLVVEYYFVDKKTNRISQMFYDHASYIENSGRIWWQLNDFIVNTCYEDTWADRDALYSDKTDYTKLESSVWTRENCI